MVSRTDTGGITPTPTEKTEPHFYGKRTRELLALGRLLLVIGGDHNGNAVSIAEKAGLTEQEARSAMNAAAKCGTLTALHSIDAKRLAVLADLPAADLETLAAGGAIDGIGSARAIMHGTSGLKWLANAVKNRNGKLHGGR